MEHSCFGVLVSIDYNLLHVLVSIDYFLVCLLLMSSIILFIFGTNKMIVLVGDDYSLDGMCHRVSSHAREGRCLTEGRWPRRLS